MIQLTASIILLLLLLLALTLVDPYQDSIVSPTCGSGVYSHGSTFERNLNLVMNSLVLNVGETGYNVSKFGENGDKVYGIAQCRGDLDASACGGCVEQASKALLQNCNTFLAYIYLGRCFLLYQTFDFHTKVIFLDGLFCNNTNNTNSSDARIFDWSTASLLTQLVVNTVNASNAGYSTLSGKGVYAMAQCWKELSMDNCRLCLNSAYQQLINCPQGSLANWVLYESCIIRYDRYKFYGDPVLHNSGSSVQSRKGMDRHVPVIVGSTIATASIVMFLGVIVWKARAIRHWYNKIFFPPNSGLSNSSLGYSTAISKSKLNYKFQTLQIATKNFNEANKLGQGSSGSVYKGELTEGREIAVKRLFSNKEQAVKEFFNEVDLVSRVQHKNLVQLFGCSVDGPDRLLVYEYVPNKSLDYFLFGDENMRKVLNWQRRFDIILGVAAGMTYLHEQSEIRIIHRDIKASNILLDRHFKPKIGDFGLARYFAEDHSHLSTGIAGTLGYVAPDYVVHGQLTEKVDVYSFGVLVLEIISGRKNRSQFYTSQSLLALVWNHYLSHTLSNIIDDNIEKDYNDEVKQVAGIALLCTQASATLRPLMSKVITLLTSNEPCLPPPKQPPFIDANHPQSYSSSPSQPNIVDNNHDTSGYLISKLI
jgi:hypothetical protein